ncbi:hypothetical protein GMRT_14129 [Giardia muris]|uniref:Uncharacterized protein n=1 Tax=Giardia muris TaxID=5742 RepID=A0A4Z1SXU3_GIAMU|nr:hypothetical protein GMRT_14129 [Giardia muris]|eukprot:TNJ28338.1 hypothetical protein GMRT_14129 [Giardia muris]
MFGGRKAAASSEEALKRARREIAEKDERIRTLTSALDDATQTVKDLESALSSVGITPGQPNPIRDRDIPEVGTESTSQLPPYPPHTSSALEGSALGLKELQDSGFHSRLGFPLELSGTHIEATADSTYNIASFRDELTTMQIQITQKDRRIEELLKAVEEWRQRASAVNKEYDTFRRTILDMSVCNSDLRSQLHESQLLVEDQRSQIAFLMEKDEKREQAYNSLMASANAKDQAISILTKSRLPYKSRRDSMVSNLQDSTLTQSAGTHLPAGRPSEGVDSVLISQLQEKTAEIARLHDRLADKEEEILQLSTLNEDAVHRILDLQSRLDESIKANELLRDQLQTATEDARLLTVQAFQMTEGTHPSFEGAGHVSEQGIPPPMLSDDGQSESAIRRYTQYLETRVGELEQALKYANETATEISITGAVPAGEGEADQLRLRITRLESALKEQISLNNALRTKAVANRQARHGAAAMLPEDASFHRLSYDRNADTVSLFMRTSRLLSEASDALSTTSAPIPILTKRISQEELYAQTIKELRKLNADIVDRVIQKDDQIVQMLEMVNTSEAEVTKIKLLLEDRERSAIDVSDKLRQKEKELDYLVEEVKNSYAEVITLTNTVHAREALIKDLSTGLADSQALINKVVEENNTLVLRLNEKNAELEGVLRESTSLARDLARLREQGSISTQQQTKMAISIRDALGFLQRCIEAAASGCEGEGGAISLVTEAGLIGQVVSLDTIHDQCDTIETTVNFLASKANELKFLTESCNMRRAQLLALINEISSDVANLTMLQDMLPADSNLAELLQRLLQSLVGDLGDMRAGLHALDGK